jgi:hypothetical protein
MANELFCDEQAAREADDRGAASALRAEAFADTVGEPNRATARYKKFRDQTLGGAGSQSSKIPANPPEEQLAPAPAKNGNPLPLAMSGDDFYRAACFEAHARLINLP